MAPRQFTVDQAASLLPRLAVLIQRMQTLKRRHDDLQEKVWEYQRKMAADGHLLEAELHRVRQELAKAAAQINRLVAGMQALGCELKDIDQGLVDFRAEMNGREVYLCWKLGEPGIAWWHELEAGFAGRQPLPEKL